MTKTLRKLRSEARARDARGDRAAKSREDAVNALRKPPEITVRALAESLGLSAGIAHQIKAAASGGDEKGLQKLLSPRAHRAGRKPALTAEERNLFAAGINRLSIDGSIPSEGVIQAAMSQVASDGRKGGCKSELPSKDAFLCFRASHKEAACRRSSAKEIAKTNAERFDHVKAYADALEEMLAKHPSLRSSPEAIANADETEAKTTHGQRSRALAPKTIRAGASAPSSVGSEKHVTAVIAASAAGRIAPPFFAVAGKNAMASWAQPLSKGIFQLGGSLARYQRESWLDRDAAAHAAPKGSMEITAIHLAIGHIRRFFRKLAPPAQPLLALLDGHSSRSGARWLIKAVGYRIEAAKSPASASHFLQARDGAISKKLKACARKARGILLQRSIGAGAGAPQLKLARASRAIRCLSPQDVSVSLERAGIWPMSMQLLQPFCAAHKQVIDQAIVEKEKLQSRPKARSLARERDSGAMRKMQDILSDSRIGATSAAQKMPILLSSASAASSIIFGRPGARARASASAGAKKRGSKRLPADQESGGAPALRMTHRERLQKPLAGEEEQNSKRKRKQLARDAVKKARGLRAEKRKAHLQQAIAQGA